MKTLYLVRHAKSEWENEDIIDIDRPLSHRGYRDANAMGLKLRNQGHVPELLISSPAVRAMTTALIFCRKLELDAGKLKIIPTLYETAVADYKKAISATENKYSSLMLFAHNPTISNCARAFLPDFTEPMVTCAIICISSDCKDWKAFGDDAKLLFYDYPKNS